jgi:hypothetical protein
MSKVTPAYNAFTGGEWSPRLDGRSDVKDYASACKQLENFIVWSHGGAAKRAGTRYISTAKHSDQTTRLISFIYNEYVSYILEFGHEYIRFYTDGGQVQIFGTETAYEIVSPYTSDQVDDIRVAQSADVMYLVHPDVKPQKLIRYGDDDWEIDDVDFINGPFLDENVIKTYTMTPSAATGNITITASHDTFVSTHSGSIWKFRGHIKESRTASSENTFTNTIEADANDSVIIEIGGTWVGTLTLQRSTDDGANWVDLYRYTSNVNTTTTEYQDDVLYRVGFKTGDYTSGTANISVGILDQYGYAEITGVVDSKNVNATVIRTLPITPAVATWKWSEGAWSDALGYPTSVVFFEERLVFACTGYQPQHLWFSRLDDYENFEAGVSAADAMTVMIAAFNVDIIQWLVPSQEALHVGTIGSEWKIETTTTSPFIKATNQSSYGSARVPAIAVGEVILFIQKGNRKLRQRYYNFEPETWVSDEISPLAEHMLKDGITQLAYVDDPDPLVWMLRTDGVLIGISYDPRRKVLAYHKHTTDGLFESIAVIPGDDRDELWVVVNRGGERFIEQFQSVSWDGIEDGWYLDSAIPYNGEPAATVSGLDHLNGYDVIPVVSGAVLPAETVVSGVITLDNEYTQIVVGLPYTSILQTMSIEAGADFGTAQTKRKKVHTVGIRFYKTLGAKVGSSADDADIIPFRSSADPLGHAPSLYTGDKEIEFNKGYGKYITVYVLSDQPTPMHVLAIYPETSTYDY